MKEVVLFASAGRADLQVLLRNPQGQYCHVEIGRANNRKFHEALLSGEIPYRVDTTRADAKSNRAAQVDWDPERRQFKSDVLKDDQGRRLLFPAKLIKVVNALRSRRDDLHVAAIVLFNTHRTEPNIGHAYEEEPIAVGPVLAQWLAEEFELEPADSEGVIGLKRSGWINILDGSLQSPGTGRDAPIHREAVRRMDRCMREASQWREGLWAGLSLGGGIPNAKDVLVAAAHYRFEGRTFLWQDPQSGSPTFIDPDKEPPTCQESLLGREHATQLLWGGDFAGAYGAVVHLKKNPEEKEWIRLLEKTNRYFAGTLTDQRDLPDYLSALLDHRPRCLRVAMRAEAALWAGRIPEAISWTCTFAEDAALLDFIQRLPEVEELDDVMQTLTYLPGKQPPMQLRENLNNSGACLEYPNSSNSIYRYKPLQIPPDKEGRMYAYSTFGEGKYSRWLKIIRSEPLKKFRGVLRNYSKDYELRPVNLRHLNTHSILSEELMEKADKLFRSVNLWSTNPKGMPGNYFIGQPLAANVLKELGISNPEALYRNLVEGLCNDLANYEIR